MSLKDLPTSSTGTSIDAYIDWLKGELTKKNYGEVSIKFTVCRHQITDVRKESVDLDHTPLKKESF